MEESSEAKAVRAPEGDPGAGPTPQQLTQILYYARDQHKVGDLYEAERGYRTVLAHRPDDVDALHLLGMLACQADQHTIGIELMERAIAGNPGVAVFHVNLGNALAAEARPDEAAEAFRRALALDPDCVDALANLASTLKRKEQAAAIDLYRRALALDPDHPESHFGIAGVLRRLERFDEAEWHYRRCLELRPSLTPVYRELARFLYTRRRFSEAAAVYREWLRIHPDDPVATHNLAAITGQDIPRASDAFVRELFDAFAPTFDEDLAVLEYRAPALIGAALRQAYGPPSQSLDALDLGCGTGLCGIELRQFASRLTGVDLSGKMLARARARRIYDELTAAELTEFLRSGPADRFDVLVSGDTLVYFGPLEAVFAGAARVMKPGGCFLFTVEGLADGEGAHRIMPYGRYRHGGGYLESALAEAGFECRLTKVVLHREAGEDVEGFLAVAQRRA